jgi:hypothetical protein
MSISQSEIKEISFNFCQDKLISFDPISGGANNTLWSISFDSNVRFVIKDYGVDGRQRLRREWCYLETMSRHSIPGLPLPIWYDEERTVGVYSYVEGKRLLSEDISAKHIEEAAGHLRNVFAVPTANAYYAKDAHFSLKDHIDDINNRINVLEYHRPNTPEELACRDFVDTKIRPEWDRRVNNVIRADTRTAFTNIERFFSPSDFGFHNILHDGNHLWFVDFEYAGLDDVAKLLADFSLVPQVKISSDHKSLFRAKTTIGMKVGENFNYRLAILDYLFPIKWICIVLNIFNINKSERIFRALEVPNKEALQVQQLKLASLMFDNLKAERMT